MNQLTWFKKNHIHLNLTSIEKELNMPKSTLRHWITERRELPEKWQPILIKWVDDFKK